MWITDFTRVHDLEIEEMVLHEVDEQAILVVLFFACQAIFERSISPARLPQRDPSPEASLGRTPQGSYSPRAHSRHLLETKKLLRTTPSLFDCQIAISPTIHRAPSPDTPKLLCKLL